VIESIALMLVTLKSTPGTVDNVVQSMSPLPLTVKEIVGEDEVGEVADRVTASSVVV
jgi:hypothetical protein